MFLRPHERFKDGKGHTYWSLVETMRPPAGPGPRTRGYLGERNGSAQSRGLKRMAVFNAQGESRQLNLFLSDEAPPEDDEQAARELVAANRAPVAGTTHSELRFLPTESAPPCSGKAA